MNDKQQKLLEAMLGEMQSAGEPDGRRALLRYAQAQMDAGDRQKLNALLRDPAAVEQMLRSQQAKALLDRLRRQNG